METYIIYRQFAKPPQLRSPKQDTVNFWMELHLQACKPTGVQQNGHTTTEIQEEVALTNMGSTAPGDKRHSHVSSDKLQVPRANLNTITTLGTRRL